jgi:hypothetical protein
MRGVKDEAVTVIANLSTLDRDAFWFVMDNRDWTHPFDAGGRRRPYSDLPKSVDKLVDDPFRSLAGELRRAGGFAKDTTPLRTLVCCASSSGPVLSTRRSPLQARRAACRALSEATK